MSTDTQPRRPVTYDWPTDSLDTRADDHGWWLDPVEGEPRRWIRLVHDDGSKKRVAWDGFFRTQRHTHGPWRFAFGVWPFGERVRFCLSVGASAVHGPAWNIEPADLAFLRRAFEERRAPTELLTLEAA